MVVLDTDVLLLAFAFQRDARQTDNHAFLQRVQADARAITLYTLMEFLGKLSFNLPAARLERYSEWLLDAYQLSVIWPYSPIAPVTQVTIREELYQQPLDRMRAVGMPFLDALILNLAERTPGVSHVVTWNARHFQGKSTLAVLTPTAYLAL